MESESGTAAAAAARSCWASSSVWVSSWLSVMTGFAVTSGGHDTRRGLSSDFTDGPYGGGAAVVGLRDLTAVGLDGGGAGSESFRGHAAIWAGPAPAAGLAIGGPAGADLASADPAGASDSATGGTAGASDATPAMW